LPHAVEGCGILRKTDATHPSTALWLEFILTIASSTLRSGCYAPLKLSSLEQYQHNLVQHRTLMKAKRTDRQRYLLLIAATTILFAFLPILWLNFQKDEVPWRKLPITLDTTWKAYYADGSELFLGNHAGRVVACDFWEATCQERSDLTLDKLYSASISWGTAPYESTVTTSRLLKDMKGKELGERRFHPPLRDSYGQRLDVALLEDGSLWINFWEDYSENWDLYIILISVCGFIGFIMSNIAVLTIHIFRNRNPT
jgi:hypothetical protein